ncbi:MAG: hypothetical protein ABIH39_02020 [Candidatus Margulisiibacteriota bacterium]
MKAKLLLIIVFLLAVMAINANIIPPEITVQDEYLSKLAEKDCWNQIKVANVFIDKMLEAKGYNKTPELQRASLAALQAKYLVIPEEKLMYFNLSLRFFNKIYDYLSVFGSDEKLYQFHVYRAMTYFNFPNYFRLDNLVISDLLKAVELVPKLNKSPEEHAGLYIMVAKKYALDKEYNKAIEMAQKVMGITENSDSYMEANKIFRESSAKPH